MSAPDPAPAPPQARPSEPPPERDAGDGPAARPRLRTVQAVVNAASGSVGPRAQGELDALLARFGLDAQVAACPPDDVPTALRRAADRAPDLLIVLAGDGTARLAAELCGPDGPLVAPLPGGTMNMLPHAIYGGAPWAKALEEVLAHGTARDVSGGSVDGRGFYVAAILGAPAWWAPAREAVRHGQLRLAWLRSRRALMRAFRRRLRYSLDGGEERKVEAITFMCPLVSKAMEDEDGLEACALDPRGAADAFRLGARTLFSDLLGDWRQDPAVKVDVSRRAHVRAGGRIPAVLDGELHRFHGEVEVLFKPRAFRALAPPEPPPTAQGAHERRKSEAAAAAAAAVDALGPGGS